MPQIKSLHTASVLERLSSVSYNVLRSFSSSFPKDGRGFLTEPVRRAGGVDREVARGAPCLLTTKLLAAPPAC